MPHRLRLRSAIYPVADLAAARQWYADWLGIQPYYDTPYYVGFDVGGFELGLHPAKDDFQPHSGGGIPYWKTADLDAELWIVGMPRMDSAPLRAAAPRNVRWISRFVADDEVDRQPRGRERRGELQPQ